MILMIDNYDSFTYNIVQYLGELDAMPEVVRNDQITLGEIEALDDMRALIVSPGPCDPEKAGVSCDAIRYAAGRGIPVFGVCLGHQSIAAVFGAEIVHAPCLMHGKVSAIHHNGGSVFRKLPTPFEATRYHSLTVKPESMPGCLETTAWTEDGVIMGLAHVELPIHGVQFHPESILTEHGHQILRNFLDIIE